MISVPKELTSVVIRYNSYSWNYCSIPGMGGGTRHMPGCNQIFGGRNLRITFLYFELVHCLSCLHCFNYKQLQSTAQAYD